MQLTLPHNWTPRQPRTATYAGKPCQKGHDGRRYVKTGRCVQCQTATWEKRREARAAYAQEWAVKNPEHKRANFAAWRERNAEHDRQKSREWQQQNPGKIYAAMAKRKAALLQRIPAWADLSAVESIYEQAVTISLQTGIPHEVDHIYPLQGTLCSGFHVAANLRVIPATENRRKGNRLV